MWPETALVHPVNGFLGPELIEATFRIERARLIFKRAGVRLIFKRLIFSSKQFGGDRLRHQYHGVERSAWHVDERLVIGCALVEGSCFICTCMPCGRKGNQITWVLVVSALKRFGRRSWCNVVLIFKRVGVRLIFKRPIFKRAGVRLIFSACEKGGRWELPLELLNDCKT